MNYSNILSAPFIRSYNLSLRSVSTALPANSRGLCQFRWRQPKHSGIDKDVWAIDDILLVSPPVVTGLSPGQTVVTEETPDGGEGGAGGGGLTSLAVEMRSSEHLDYRLTANLGDLEDSFCGRMRSLK